MEFMYTRSKAGIGGEEKKALFDEALAEAMKQIHGRGYYKKYVGSKKEANLAAFSFFGRDEIEMRVDTMWLV